MKVAELVGRIAIEGGEAATASLRGVRTGFVDAGAAAKAAASDLGGLPNALSKLPGPLGDISARMSRAADAGESMGTVLAGGIAAGALVAGKALFDAAEAAADYNIAMGAMADRAGVAVDFMARFAQAADAASMKQRGVALEAKTVGDGIQALSQHLGRAVDAQGQVTQMSSATAGALNELGVVSSDASGRMRPVRDILMDVADGMSKLENPSQRAAVAQRLFGSAGRELLPILQQGRDGVRDMMSAVSDAVVPTEESTKAAIEYRNALKDLGDALNEVKLGAGTAVVPVLTGLAKGVSELFDKVKTAKDGVGAFAQTMEVGFSGALATEAGVLKLGEAIDKQVKALENSKAAGDLWYVSMLRQNQAYVAYIDATKRAADEMQRLRAVNDDGTEAARAAAEQTAAYWREYERGTQVAHAASERMDALNAKLKDEKAAQDAAAKAAEGHRAALDALGSNINRDLPGPAKPRDKMQMTADFITGGDNAVKLAEMTTLSSSIGAAAEAGVDPAKLADIFRRANTAISEGGMSVKQALQAVLDVSPPRVDAKIAPVIKDLIDAENLAGVGGDAKAFEGRVKSVKVFVKGTEDGARDLAIANGQLDQAMQKRKDLEGAWATWKATGWMPPDWNETRYKAEMAKIANAIDSANKDVADAKRRAEGYWTTQVQVAEPTPAQRAEIGGSDGAAPTKTSFADVTQQSTAVDLPAAKVNVTAMGQELGSSWAEGAAKGIQGNASFVDLAWKALIDSTMTAMTAEDKVAAYVAAGSRWALALADGFVKERPRVEAAFNQAVDASIGNIIDKIVRGVYARLR